MKLLLKLIILSLVLNLLPASIASANQAPIKVILNGQKLVFKVDPFVESGTTFVEFRTIFEKLGLSVAWDQNTRTVTGQKDGLKLSLQLGKTIALVNGKQVSLPVAPKVVNGSTFVPLRFVSEASGNEVLWDSKSNTITIGTGNTPSIDIIDSNKKLLTDETNGNNLVMSAYEGNLKLVKELIEKGVDPNYIVQEKFNKYTLGGETPLTMAAENNHSEIMKYLLENGAKPNHGKYSALYSTVLKQNEELALLLLDLGADPNYISAGSVLDQAVTKRNVTLVKALIENGADPNYSIENNQSRALRLSLNVYQTRLEDGTYVQVKVDKEIVLLLLDNGAKFNDDTLISAMGADPGSYEIVEVLLIAGADPNAVHSFWKKTPLQWAEYIRNDELKNLLIQYGAK